MNLHLKVLGTHPRVVAGWNFRLFAILMSLTILASLTAFVGPLAAQTNTMGMNLSNVADYAGDRLFADAMKQGREWSNVGTTDGAASLDSNGWPTEDASVVVWHGTQNMHGTYKLVFNGQADVSLSWADASIANKTYNATSNTTTADLIYRSTGGNGLLLSFRNTRRTSSGALNGGLTNIKLMRPLTPGSTTNYATTVTFTTPIKNLAAKFSVVRMMDATGSNGGTNLNGVWAYRRPTTYASQAARYVASGAAQPTPGMAWEYAIQFWNETDKDAYVNIPFPADDNYVSSLATLLKNNLEADRKVYVEYSNELWNSFGSFPYGVNKAAAVSEVNAGGSPLNYDGSTDQHVWAMRRIGKRGKEVSDIFRSVFGESAMMSRVRPLLMSQLGNEGATLRHTMLFLDNYYNNGEGNRVTTPHPISYYFYGGGGSAYYSPNNNSDTLTADSIISTLMANGYFDTGTKVKDVDWATSFGLKRIAYEGGPGLDNLGHSEAAKEAAWNDPRMKDVVIAKHNQWSAAGGDVLLYFFAANDLSSYYQWAFTNNIHNLNTPKLQGINALVGQPRAALTYGPVVPASLPVTARNLDYKLGSGVDTKLVNAGGWVSWTFRVTQAGTYTFKTNVTGTNQQILVDGVLLGTPGATPLTRSLQTGLHAVRVKCTSGSFWLGNVDIGLSVTFNAKINFQPTTSTVPAGYVLDDGDAFGDRGNGYTYGWFSGETPTANSNARDRDSVTDQRYDTLNHMQYFGTYIWKIVVPNGTYSVRIVAGDPSNFNSYYKIAAEDVVVVDGAPNSTTNVRWVEGTQTVTVADGYLTITNAAGSDNNKICFIDISRVS